MRFEHLVQINDLQQPGPLLLTRNQLWQGLVLRAESPMEFVEHIDESEVLQRSAHGLQRRVVMGQLEVLDHIAYQHEESVHYDTQPSAKHLGGQMWMKIEEPESGALFVRFIYETPHPDDPDPELEKYLRYLQSAWQQMDLDTVITIREMAASGSLG